jgi:transposase
MGAAGMEADKKKAKKRGLILIFLDESGFSMSPTRGTTWCEIGKPMVLREVFSRNTQTGLGFITMTPEQRRLNFRFTIFSGVVNTEDVIFFLTQIHHHYGKKVMIIWDRLSSHISAERFFVWTHPHWFVFEYLPSYSPELNPVEQCWHHMKNVQMANFVPLSVEHLTERALQAAQVINNDPKLMAEFFNHARLKP